MPIRSVASLSPEQAAVVWCFRTWVDGLASPREAEARLNARLAELGVQAVAPFLGAFMARVREGAFRAIVVGCAGQPGVSEDEQALLDVLALCQEARVFEALLQLRGLVAGEATSIALEYAEKIASALTRAGWFLPAPDCGMRQFGFPRPESGAAARRPEAIGGWAFHGIVARVFSARHEGGRQGSAA
jgi:hypothetical protein